MKNTLHRSLFLLAVLSGCDESRLKVFVDKLDAGDLPDAPPAGPDAFVPPITDAAVYPDAPAPPDVGPQPDLPPAIVCGNGAVELGETCDDGNSVPGDGCSGICRTEPNFSCPTPAAPCTSLIVCGDGKVMGSEGCDDGNEAALDGCSDVCQVEAGYACAMPGTPCTKVPTARCGDGVVNQGEMCDDGGSVGSDGCSTTCQLEPGWTCAMPGKACVKDEYCGDGKLNGLDQCDDGNINPGDGCSGTCRTEPFFECNVPGTPCTSTIICGDGKVIGDEACDDGNKLDGDGCAADCRRVEAGWSCPTAAGVGGPCTMAPQDRCGDSRLSFGEYCDDGNMTPGDGCSADCKVDPGYTCPTVGMACKLIGWCGDGKLSIADGEACDDGDKDGNDGCSAQCVVEANWVCPTPGQPCQSTVVCGDRKLTGAETCDDGNLTNGDGCSSTCVLETGWTCPPGGTCRPTRCGDSLKVGPEQCDDGNSANGDGCSSLCLLELAGDIESNGWMCPTVGQPCVRTTCGNGVKEGSEICDDGNNDTGDGCSPFCRKEPVCPSGGGACSTSCGDGLLLPVDMAAGQECDDGNTNSGDGCSSDCKRELGYSCTSVPIVRSLYFPIVYRDFKGLNETNGHPDFENWNGQETGIVQATLGTNGKPLHVTGQKNSTRNNDPGVTFDFFGVWYKDDASYNKTIRDYLLFTQLPSGAYEYSNQDFFPLDNRGWGNFTGGTDHNGNQRNFHFTSELRYWFEYKGGEKLEFQGDDDVWVFINKRLAVDIGGVHGVRTGSVTLHASNGTGASCDLVTTCPATRTVSLGLTIGSVYEIVVFQAERHTQASNYKLTLSNFTGTRSSCSSVCGDGHPTADEACDLGAARNTGQYGTCNPNCTLTPRCGDAMVQTSNEQCDDGVNQSTYGGTGLVCAPGCVYAPRCGDGAVNSANGEACDQGADNGKGYGYCSATCQLGPRCGDGVTTHTEECDDGMNNGTSTSACMATCKKKCGNGLPDPLEQCDEGTANNTGGYGKCNANCTLGPRCGDGIKNGAEECDDGKNDGSYGACAPMCKLGPRCGDGMVQSTAGEGCDQGAMNQASPYGANKCSTRCRPAPYCGDKAVDTTFGERCDDGMNTGQPGSCTMDCSAAVPNPSCGDGVMQSNEQCDDGAANGSAGSTCDITCHRKCGNGFRDPGEACDDGKNDGSYGTCNANCTLAGYCGDGTRNGPEQCDQGSSNAANPYGAGKCTTSCTNAPYCGDGRIQTEFGEACDGTAGCTNTCQILVIQ